MGFRFCYGPSGSGKSRFLHRYLLQNAQIDLDSPAGPRTNYIMLVPEQYSMLTQKDLVLESPNKGILNIDVLSFGRLAYRVFSETGVSERAVLDDTGKTLLLRRTAGLCADQLSVLKGAVQKPGMISEIKSILSEFMQYGIDSEALLEMAGDCDRKGQGALAARLRDLSVLYTSFLEGEREHFMTSEERMELLAQAIPSSDYLKGSVIVMDGFTGFTPLQYDVIQSLIRAANDVIISLPMREDGGPSIEETVRSMNPGREDALFYLSRKTVADLVRRVSKEHEKGVRGQGGTPSHGRDIAIGGQGEIPPRFGRSPALAHMENNLFRHPAVVFDGDIADQIRLIETDTIREEVRQICIQIRRLVLEEGYEYRQISVICGDLPTYGELFEQIGARYHIPMYVDKTSTSVLNPLTESLRAVLQIAPQNYSYQAVFRYLRSGMSGLTGDETDILENYCLAHGIRGKKKWEMAFDADTEPLRVRFLEEIRPVTDCGKTAAERAKALYAFMVNCSMEEKMLERADSFGESGDYVRQKQFDQLYASVIHLLEQMVDILGDEVISGKDFAQILEAGFAEIRLGTLPQQVDRVLIGDIERTRVSQCRILFLAGVNEGNIPAGTSKGGILSDLDREFLRGTGAELAPTPREQMYLQRLYLYMNMTKPTERLYLSMARSDAGGNALQPSYLIGVMKAMFPSLEAEHPQLESPGTQITGWEDSLPWVSEALREYADRGENADAESDDTLLTLYGYMRRNADPERTAVLDELSGAAFMRYDPKAISEDVARKLYGDRLRGSITRLETMAKCPMQQFLTYGLGLKEREEYKIEPADTGSILHESFERFEGKMRKEGLTWRSASDEEAARLMHEALEETAASYHDLILYSTARSTYQKKRLEEVLQTSVSAIRYQLDHGDFEPAFSEFVFGENREAGPLEFDLERGGKLSLSGRIDRIDLVERPDNVYVKVLDYKLGSKDLKLDQMKKGLQLQLMIYMQAVLEYFEQKGDDRNVVPAAMFYMQMTEPLLKIGDQKTADQWDLDGPLTEAELETSRKNINAAMRPTGMVCSDPDVIAHLDRGLDGKSDVIPVSLKANGEIRSGAHAYSLEEYESLYAQIRDKVRELASNILNGDAAASPCRIERDQTACTWCPFKDVCVFDPRISGFAFRNEEPEA